MKTSHKGIYRYLSNIKLQNVIYSKLSNICGDLKQVILILSLLICSYNSFSQIDKNGADLLMTLISPYKQETIAYVDSAVPYDTTSLFKRINQDTLFNPNNIEYLVLTSEEKVLIISEVIRNNNYCWDAGLFDISLMVKKDSMWDFLKGQNTLIFESLHKAITNSDSISINNYKDKYVWVFLFSKPIFFRNESVCLLSFYAFMAPSAGHHEMGFYKKNKGKWEGWIGLSSGDW